MKRFLAAMEGQTMGSFFYVSPFIDFEEIYSQFHAEAHGLSEEEGVGFLQHYGFPTDLVDFSPSVDTARFFAMHGRETEPIGLLGVFPRIELERYFRLTDLSNHPTALRPKRQVAFAGRPPVGIVDLKNPASISLLKCRWYRFHKSTADHDFAKSQVSYIYPSETELAYFFGRDFMEFFQAHWTGGQRTEAQRRLVEDRLEAIQRQLR
jgi:hypothetical protein